MLTTGRRVVVSVLKCQFGTLSASFQRIPVSAAFSAKFIQPKFISTSPVSYGPDGEKRISLTDEIIKELGTDESKIKALKVIEFECNVWYEEGEHVPQNLNVEQWKCLLEYSHFKKKKFLRFLATREIRAVSDKEKIRKRGERLRAEAAERREVFKENTTSGISDYGFSKNTIFLKVLDATTHKWYHNSIVDEMRLGTNPVVFDFSYDQYMQKPEIVNLADQMCEVWQTNRTHPRPLPLVYVNAQKDGQFMKYLTRQNPRICDLDYPIPVTEKHYLDLFPKEKLIHLTPDSRVEVSEFDHDAIYIVGGIVDKTNREALTFAKAKREGIRTMRLPLERYLPWGAGSKALPLNHIMEILLQLRLTGDWEEALKVIPRRKLKSREELSEIFDKEAKRKKLLQQRRAYDEKSEKRKPSWFYDGR